LLLADDRASSSSRFGDVAAPDQAILNLVSRATDMARFVVCDLHRELRK